MCEIGDIVNNISEGLKYRGNNKKTLDYGGKLSCLFTNTSSDPEMRHAMNLNMVGGRTMNEEYLTAQKGKACNDSLIFLGK